MFRNGSISPFPARQLRGIVRPMSKATITREFACPNCRQKACAKPDARLICGTCKQRMHLTAKALRQEIAVYATTPRKRNIPKTRKVTVIKGQIPRFINGNIRPTSFLIYRAFSLKG